MNQIKFGRRYAIAPRARQHRQAVAITAASDDNRLSLGLMIAAGMLTGFLVAAIECL